MSTGSPTYGGVLPPGLITASTVSRPQYSTAEMLAPMFLSRHTGTLIIYAASARRSAISTPEPPLDRLSKYCLLQSRPDARILATKVCVCVQRSLCCDPPPPRKWSPAANSGASHTFGCNRMLQGFPTELSFGVDVCAMTPLPTMCHSKWYARFSGDVTRRHCVSRVPYRISGHNPGRKYATYSSASDH